MERKHDPTQWYDAEIYDSDEYISSIESPIKTIKNTKTTPNDNKHPLLDTWTLWYDDPSEKNSNDWKSSMLKVYRFSTVEDFWVLYNNLRPASLLNKRTSYSLFKEGITPDWDDNHCKNGGRWYFCLRLPNENIDDLWLNLLLGVIGSTIDSNNHICGCIVESRPKEMRLSLWTKHANNKADQMIIGNNIKKTLEYAPGISFQAFELMHNRRMYMV